MNLRSIPRAALLAAFAAATFPGVARAQVQGSIAGRVTDVSNGQAIPQAQVSVVGTSLGAQTNAQGQYTIRGLNPGQIELRTLRVGFTEQRSCATTFTECSPRTRG